MKIEVLVNSRFASTTNIIILPESQSAWVVDCGDTQRILEFLSRYKVNLIGVLLTHGHFDHMYGLNELVSYIGDIKVMTNPSGAEMLMDSRKNLSYYHNSPIRFDYPDRIVTVSDRQLVSLSDGISAEALFTPGHNPSCISWVVRDAIFTGDSYIPGLKTVTNLPGSNKVDAGLSEKKIIELSKGRTIYPGHRI